MKNKLDLLGTGILPYTLTPRTCQGVRKQALGKNKSPLIFSRKVYFFINELTKPAEARIEVGISEPFVTLVSLT